MACDRRKQPRREQFVITLEGMPGFAAPPIVRVRRPSSSSAVRTG
jgi:hypothetical protein